MKDYISEKYKHLLHGADYNPDQWLEYPDVLSEDMRLFKLSNSNELTLGIFAWSALEPEEDKFNFEWLDKVMDDIYAAGGRVILATPSGARPAWLSQKYPEVLRTNNRNEKQMFGERHNHCFTSPIYRAKVAKIDKLLAERYKDHPALIAWHLSNEFGGECHCELCKSAFREWLKNKYGTLENLNKQWWTSFWSHTFTDWEQIDPPTPLGDWTVHGKTLDWKRFVTDQTANFIRNEYQSIKPITPDIPITTNLMGFYLSLDYHRIAQEIDFVSWDNYPAWHGDSTDIGIGRTAAMSHDLMRSLKKRPFYLMESTPSLVNWMSINKLKRPGMHMLSSIQAIAHGSDSVQYFQWRKSRGSSEKFHGAVVDHVGTENNRVFKDVAEVGARLKAIDEVAGTTVNAQVAILYDWDCRWALEDAAGFQKDNKKVRQTFNEFYNALWDRGINVDFISENDNDFSKYKVIFAPVRYMVSEQLGKKIADFVKNGGTIVCTYTTGMVNENDLCYLGGFPGAGLREVFGIWNEEIDTLYPGESNTVITNDGTEYKAVDYCEIIHDEGATVLARYNSDFYKGLPAATVNNYGQGKAYYIAFRDDNTYVDKMVADILAEANVNSDFDGELPHGVSAHSRTDGETTYVFLENFSNTEITTSTNISWTKVDTLETLTGTFTMKPNEILILKK